MVWFMDIPNIYENPNTKYYILLPLALMAISLALVFFGPGLQPGIDLKGGMLVTVQFSHDVDSAKLSGAIEKAAGEKPSMRFFDSPTGKGVEIELALKPSLDAADSLLASTHVLQEQYDAARIALSQGQGGEAAVERLRAQVVDSSRKTVETAGRQLNAKDASEAVLEAERAVSEARTEYRESLLNAVQSVVTADSVSVREVGSSLSAFFLVKTREVVFLAFLLSGILILVIFRSLVASFAVIFGALADIVITLGVMSLLGIGLSLASIAALLMLIGFSLDTDVMLTTRVLKRRDGTPAERAFEAMKTGFMMNLTTVVAFGVLLVLAIMLQIPTYYQIGLVATIGGLVDFIATWAGNAPLVLQFAERKQK